MALSWGLPRRKGTEKTSTQAPPAVEMGWEVEMVLEQGTARLTGKALGMVTGTATETTEAAEEEDM